MSKFELKDPLSWFGENKALDEKQSVTEIEVDKIKIVYSQPRKNLSGVEMDELIDSVKTHGLIEPVIVKQSEDKKSYNLICGERRLSAFKFLGLARIASVVRNDIKDKDVFIIQIIENIQRKNLEPLELAKAYKKLSENMSIKNIASLVGKGKTHVRDMLTLLSVEKELKGKIKRNNVRKAIEVARTENDAVKKEMIENFDDLNLNKLKNKKFSTEDDKSEELNKLISEFNNSHFIKISLSLLRKLNHIDLNIPKNINLKKIIKQLSNLKED